MMEITMQRTSMQTTIVRIQVEKVHALLSRGGVYVQQGVTQTNLRH